MHSPAPISRPAGETTIRLEDIAAQLSQLARREQESATFSHYDAPAPRDRDQETLNRILNRVESNERQTVEAFTAVNERLSVLGRQMALAARQKAFEKPEDVPGFASLETAIRNVVDHIEVSENRTRETLKTLQDRLTDMTNRAAAAPGEDVLRAVPAFAALETRMLDIGQRLQHHEQQIQAQAALPQLVREEIGKLGTRIDDMRASPAIPNQVESRLSELDGRLQQQEAQAGFPKQVREEMRKLGARVDELRANPAYAALESRLNGVDHRLQQQESQAQGGLTKVVRDELAKLAGRIDEVRGTSHALAREAQTAAVAAAQNELRDIEMRIHGLLREAQAAMSGHGPATAELQRMRSEIAVLNDRINDQTQDTASDADVQALRVAVEQLSARVAQGADMRPLADLDRKLADIAGRVEQAQIASRNPPHLADLERRMGEIDKQLQQALSRPHDAAPASELEQKIAAFSDRLGRTEEQLGHFATIERAITQLYDAFEQSKESSQQAAEEAVSRVAERVLQARQGETAHGPSPELLALQDGLKAVRQSAEASDQRSQETLAAVHETLEQIVGKLAELETSAAGHQLAMNMAQQFTAPPAAAAVSMPPPAEPDFTPPEISDTFEPVNEAFTAPGHTLQPDMPPAPAMATPDLAAQADSGPQAYADDYIAAARRLAQAASGSAPPAAAVPPLNAGAPASPASGGRRFKLPFVVPKFNRRPKPMTFTGGKLVTEEKPVAKAMNRRTLVMVGLALLVAAGLFGARMMMKPAAPAKQTSQIETTITAPGSAPAQVVADAQAEDPVDLPAGSASSDDTLITGSLPAKKTEASLTSIVAQPGTVAQATETPPAAIGSQSLRDAAVRGDATAQFVIASRYLDGQYIPQDFTKAAYWYQQAASRGLAPAEYRIATLFERGKGVPQDAATALVWYERSAEAGNVKAMHNAAVLAASGQAGTPNYDKAFRWFGEAARHGLKDSQFNLAVLYERGLGTKVDVGEAYFWYRLAAGQGDKDAGSRADILKKTMPAATIASVEQRAGDWKAETESDAANVVAVTQADWNTPADAMAAPAETPPAASGAASPIPAPSSGDPVKSIQQMLQKLGYNVGTPDGKMGLRTASAIRLFQLQSGMKVTGEATPELLTEMQNKAG